MGAILSLINGAISLANKLVSMFQRKQDRDAGVAAQQLKDATDELQAIRDGNRAAADPDGLQRVRDTYSIDRPR